MRISAASVFKLLALPAYLAAVVAAPAWHPHVHHANGEPCRSRQAHAHTSHGTHGGHRCGHFGAEGLPPAPQPRLPVQAPDDDCVVCHFLAQTAEKAAAPTAECGDAVPAPCSAVCAERPFCLSVYRPLSRAPPRV